MRPRGGQRQPARLAGKTTRREAASGTAEMDRMGTQRPSGGLCGVSFPGKQRTSLTHNAPSGSSSSKTVCAPWGVGGRGGPV